MAVASSSFDVQQNGGHTTVQMMAMVTGDSRQREWMSAKRTIGSERHQPSTKYIGCLH